MKYLNQFWNWLDGKKTAIGAILSLGTAYLMAKGWIGDAEVTLLLGFSTLFVGVGLSHKAVKPAKK